MDTQPQTGRPALEVVFTGWFRFYRSLRILLVSGKKGREGLQPPLKVGSAQVFITCCEEDRLHQLLQGNVYYVSEGRITE